VRYQPDRSLEFLVPVCGDEKVDEVQLFRVVDPNDRSTDVPLWTLRSGAGGLASSIVVFGARVNGANADGLQSLNALVENYSDQRLFITSTTSEAAKASAAFTLRNLATDGSVVLSGSPDRVVAFNDWPAVERDMCSTTAYIAPSAVAAIAMTLAVGGGFVVWIVRRRRDGPSRP
jgi:hypothetical protein